MHQGTHLFILYNQALLPVAIVNKLYFMKVYEIMHVYLTEEDVN